MPELLRMPAVSASTTEAVLARWPLAVGAAFAAKDVIVTVETDKAVVDVEAEIAGSILRTLVEEGAEVPVGAAIAVLCGVGERVDDVDAALAALGVGPAPKTPASSGPASTPAAAVPAPTPAAPPGRVFSSPLARRLAAEAGLRVEDVPGTGPGGRIVRRDVEAAVDRLGARPPAPAPVPVLPAQVPAELALEEVAVRDPGPAVQPGASVQPPPAGGADVPWSDQPLTRMRRAVAARLTESKATAPHFYLRGTARVDDLLALRAQLNAHGGPKVSVNDLVVKAVAQAHQLVPEMNVVWTGDAIRSFAGVDIAVAVATGTGLLTPVVRAVERCSISAVASATADLAGRAKDGRLQQSELEGGSITVTNLGMFGTQEFAAILNPPQAAILAVGAATPQPVVVDGRLEVGTVLTVTLSVDHRPVDGATAARWMSAFVALLEAPLRVLA